MVRKFAGALLALALVGGIVVAGPVAPTYAASTPDFTPSSNGVRKFMLNVVGSVLGGAMPNKWRAEQLANQYRYNHSWDGFNAQFGFKDINPATGVPYAGAGTGTYDDAVIAKYEEQLAKGGSGGKPLAPPSTKTQKFVKTVGGAATAITGFSFGTMIGSAGAELFGLDVDGLVCSQGDASAFLSIVTGSDCAAFDLANEYVPNSDSTTSTTLNVCVSGVCVDFKGDTRAFAPSNSNNSIYSCWFRSDQPVTAKLGLPFAVSGSRDGGASWTEVWTTAAVGSGFSAFWNSCNGMGGNAGVGVAAASGLATYPLFRGGTTGTPAAPVVTNADPDRHLTCSVVGDDGITYTMDSAVYKESSGEVAVPECPGLPEGVGPSSVKVEEKGNGDPKQLYNETVTPEYSAWWNAYPECRGGQCPLDLVRVAPTPAESCFGLDTACADWFADPNKTANYECRYGTHVVDLTECYVYARVFEPGAVEAGSPYADPTTGVWSGGQSSPTAASSLMGSTVQDPEVTRQCLPQGWGVLNPVEWVLRPVQCALEWAFVPRPAVTAFEAESMKAAWDGTSVVQVAGVATTFGTVIGAVDGSCEGPPVTFPESLAAFGMSGTWHPLTACDGVPATLAGISRASTVAAVALGAVFAMMHFFGVSIGFVGMGRGRDS